MATFHLIVNNAKHQVDVEPDMPLLWVLRNELGLKGSKFGCGIAQCGACTIHLDGQALRSCILPISAVGDRHVTTIEGLSAEGDHPVQRAWIDENVPQCGYCQAGQIMAATAMLAKTPNPSDQQIDDVMSGNICRCGTYPRIKKAIRRVAEQGGAS